MPKKWEQCKNTLYLFGEKSIFLWNSRVFIISPVSSKNIPKSSFYYISLSTPYFVKFEIVRWTLYIGPMHILLSFLPATNGCGCSKNIPKLCFYCISSSTPYFVKFEIVRWTLYIGPMMSSSSVFIFMAISVLGPADCVRLEEDLTWDQAETFCCLSVQRQKIHHLVCHLGAFINYVDIWMNILLHKP